MAVLYGNDAFSVLVLLTKKLYSNFLKKVFVFQKTCYKVKVLKKFKVSTERHMKTCRSLKRRAILKILSIIFFEEPMLFLLALKSTSKKKRFQVLIQKPTQISRKTCWKEQPFIFTAYLMNHIFQRICTLNRK